MMSTSKCGGWGVSAAPALANLEHHSRAVSVQRRMLFRERIGSPRVEIGGVPLALRS